ncbi:MAG: flavodoxin-dependent (E)-4-hydroxy-3-methylbut-2-enyl-diphosphate synthase [Treponema sp.]|nr:flavodoxin-dependent (E)-4-hydroxy-3-methylbut-2-enyl-diphosphate synthase [Treponema sp.]MCL2271899.1 flavodoxin-dependent (E)-4-hydroxy-3-methylbut-2-enyl-diphosphate synthase [Treponema sp.]
MLSKIVNIGGFSHVRSVQIGGASPVVVQTMWKDSLSDTDLKDDSTVKKIQSLENIGCGLLRFAVPDIKSAEILGSLAQKVSMPLVADIHFDYKIALRCLDYPIAKLRINPGNIGGREKVRVVLEKAAAKNVPVRIGVNAGSLPQDLSGLKTAQALVQAAQRELSVFKEFGFNNVLVSMKASGIADTIEANRLFSRRMDTPLHLGVTEAGPLADGIAANTAALCMLLKEGIGDTIRVSLSDSMENEVIAGRAIIRAAAQLTAENERLKLKGVKIVSCPRCGRHAFDTLGFTNRWLSRLYAMEKDITVAIMGCEVNGPTEAKHASLGITGAGDKVLVFKQGKVIKTICAAEADKIFEEELMNL